jgi:hypothetical protein
MLASSLHIYCCVFKKHRMQRNEKTDAAKCVKIFRRQTLLLLY